MDAGIGIRGLSEGQDEYAIGHFDLFRGEEIENSIAEVTRIATRPISVASSRGPSFLKFLQILKNLQMQSLLDSMDKCEIERRGLVQ